MSEQEPIKLKAKFERCVKKVEFDTIAIRYAINPDTLKSMSATFLIHFTVSVENSKSFKDFTVTKAILPYRYSWMEKQALRTRIYYHVDEVTREIFLDAEAPIGILIEKSEPKKITPAQAQNLIDSEGCRIFEIDEFDRLKSLAVYSMKR